MTHQKVTPSARSNWKRLGTHLSRSGWDPQEIQTFANAAERGCLQEVIILKALHRAGGKLIKVDAGNQHIDYQGFSDLFHAEDGYCDFAPSLRAYRHLLRAEGNGGQLSVEQQCARLNLCATTYRQARQIHAHLLTIFGKFGLSINESPAELQSITACFLQAYPERVLVGQEFNKNLLLQNVSANFADVLWFNKITGLDHRPTLVLITNCTLQDGSMIVTEAVEVNAQELKEALPNRVHLRIDELVANRTWREVSSHTSLYFDEQFVQKRRLDPAPVGPETTAAIVTELLKYDDRSLVMHINRNLLAEVRRAHALMPLSGVSVPALVDDIFIGWACAQVNNAQTFAAVKAQESQLQLSWEVLAKLTDTPDVKARVDGVARDYPSELKLGDTTHRVRYHLAGKELTGAYSRYGELGDAIVIEYRYSSNSIDVARDEELPPAWKDKRVCMEIDHRIYVSDTFRLDGAFFDTLRCKHAAQGRGGGVTLIKAVLNNHECSLLWQKPVMGRAQPIYQAYPINYKEEGNYFTSYSDALDRSREVLAYLVKRNLNERSKLHPHMVEVLTNQVMLQVGSDLSNVACLPRLIDNLVAGISVVTNGKDRIRKLFTDLHEKIKVSVRQIGERQSNRLLARLLALDEDINHLLAQGNTQHAQHLLQEVEEELAALLPNTGVAADATGR